MPGTGRRPAGITPVTAAAVLEYLSAAETFAPGHPLRKTRCLLCAEMIGGRPFIVHQTVDLRQEACTCGGLAGTIFVVCAAHELLDDDTLMRLALDRAGRHHRGMP